jgi:two-component system sensor histidine kinase MprB
MRFRGTLAARVALLATIAVGLSVAFVSAAAYLTVRHQLFSALDESLVERARTLADLPEVGLLVQGNLQSVTWDVADVEIVVADTAGKVVVESTNARIKPSSADLRVAAGGGYVKRTVYLEGEPYRAVGVPATDSTVLILAQSLEPTRETLGRLGFLLALFGLAGVVGAGFAGLVVARNGLAPVRRLSAAVEEIARTQRLEPIPEEGNDEVATLAATFNRMLAALAASRTRQKQLVADAGHELRTPLTSLRTNIELLTQAESRGGLSPESRAELLGDVRFQIEELTTLIGDLTELARDEPATAQWEEVDLLDVVARALDRVRRRAPGLHFDVDLEPWPVVGARDSLERAVTNLLDNAVKWSPAQGTVTVRLARGVLYVADQGPGISEEDLPHVFERFYRSDESRTMPGSGLGLSIVRAVVDRHGGMVRAGRAEEGGAAFWLWLPPGGAAAASDADSHPA